MGLELGLTELAKALEIDKNLLQAQRKLGAPIPEGAGPGKRISVDLAQYFKWALRHAGGGSGGEGQKMLDHQQEQAKLNQTRQRKLEIETLEMEGTLVSAESVRKTIAEEGRRLKDGLLALPDRLADTLAAESNSHKVHQALQREILGVLEGCEYTAQEAAAK